MKAIWGYVGTWGLCRDYASFWKLELYRVDRNLLVPAGNAGMENSFIMLLNSQVKPEEPEPLPRTVSNVMASLCAVTADCSLPTL